MPALLIRIVVKNKGHTEGRGTHYKEEWEIKIILLFNCKKPTGAPVAAHLLSGWSVTSDPLGKWSTQLGVKVQVPYNLQLTSVIVRLSQTFGASG